MTTLGIPSTRITRFKNIEAVVLASTEEEQPYKKMNLENLSKQTKH